MLYAEGPFVRVKPGRVTGLRARLWNNVSESIGLPTAWLRWNLLRQFQKGRSLNRWRWSVADSWCRIVGAHQIALARAGFRRWRWKGYLSNEVRNLVRKRRDVHGVAVRRRRQDGRSAGRLNVDRRGAHSCLPRVSIVSSRLGNEVSILHLPACSRGLNRSAVNNERRGVGA